MGARALTHWHRHPLVDRNAAESLADTVAHFAELDDWAAVTLLDVARQATFMTDGRFDHLCTCGGAS